MVHVDGAKVPVTEVISYVFSAIIFATGAIIPVTNATVNAKNEKKKVN